VQIDKSSNSKFMAVRRSWDKRSWRELGSNLEL